MCLAVPGRVLEMSQGPPLQRTGRVDFGGLVKTVNLAFVPEVAVGQYVLVHVGVALQIVDEREAARVFEYLKEIDEIEHPEGV